MKSSHCRSGRLSYYASLVLLGALSSTIPAFTQDQTSAPASTAPDNTAKNKHHAVTAQKQGAAAGDRELTQKIRQAVVADKSLSMYAHNVKIITADGAVTLKGPVRSEDEKQKVASLAAEAAGGSEKITNQITIKH